MHRITHAEKMDLLEDFACTINSLYSECRDDIDKAIVLAYFFLKSFEPYEIDFPNLTEIKEELLDVYTSEKYFAEDVLSNVFDLSTIAEFVSVWVDNYLVIFVTYAK